MNGPGDENGARRFVSISNDQVYAKLERIGDDLTDLDHKVDSVLSSNADLQKRVRALELRFYGILAGLIAAAGSIFVGVKVGH